MSEFTEVTAENLKLLRISRDLGQADIAEVLGVTGNQISKIESNLRSLSDAEKKLLDWYFFGVMPKRITTFPADLRGILEFDEGEWLIITRLAKRDGFDSPRPWIAKKIRDYLAVFDVTAPLEAPNTVTFPAPKSLPSARVTEEPATFAAEGKVLFITQRGSVAAGGKSSVDVLEEEIPAGKKYPKDHYALRVLGQSMEPTIPDGSLIVVKSWREGYPKKGTIVVYNDGYGTTLKVYDTMKAEDPENPGSLGKVPALRSINPEFPDVEPIEGGRIDATFVEILSPSQG